MAVIESWPDGWILNMDPRREDPLFYYLHGDDWSHAIGIQVLPLYQERTAPRVAISVFSKHRDREMSLDTAERERMYERALPALAARHESWSEIRLTATDLPAILKSGSVARELERLGFRKAASPDPEPDSVTWSRSGAAAD
jgi:hypothetical protein